MPGFLAEVLTWPKNYEYAIAVETAMNLKLPPTVMLQEDRQPTEGWSGADKKLAKAWTILQKETCGKCGQPLWVCRSSNRDLLFKVRKGLCYASAELEKWEAGKNSTLKKGEYPYILAEMRNETDPLPSRRDYLKELADD